MTEEVSLSEDQMLKLDLAIQNILPYCKDDSECEEFRSIGAEVSNGDKLVGEVLDGATNFSYRVYLEGKPNVQIFVKVAFDYARWNPDRSAHYALDRITTEYEMLKRFSDLLGTAAPVAKPYLCKDIAPKNRMIVAQWSPSHEAWSTQFVKGEVDRRIVKKVAAFVARVNLEPYGRQDLNDGIKDSFRAIYPVSKASFHQIVSAEDESSNRFTSYAKQMGEARFHQIIDTMAVAYERCDVLLHGDTHVLNILVEPQAADASFGDKGEFFVCDWEMVHAGHQGRDPGTFRAFPILSAYFLASRGEKAKALDTLECLEEFWNVYIDTLKKEKEGTDEAFLEELYRASLGWTGVYAFIANYILGIHQNCMPRHLLSEKATDECMSAFAITGLKCLEAGFMKSDCTRDYGQLKEWFRNEVKGQIEYLDNATSQ